jgi:V/A-type H+-transporting ATPase subunit I
MIAKMKKVFIAARQADRDALLETLRELGVVHIVPVDPGRATPDEQTQHDLDALARAEQILDDLEAAETKPDVDAVQAAREVLDIQRRRAELASRLTNLYRKVEELRVWGNVTLEQLQALDDSGLNMTFALVPVDAVDDVQADCVERIAERPDGLLIAAVTRGQQPPELPEEAEELELPTRDRPTLRAEAAEISEQLKADQDRLRELANLRDAIVAKHREVQSQADFAVAAGSGLAQDTLFAVQGWVPAEEADALAQDLIERDFPATVELAEQAPTGQQPPTLVKYPRWAKPIKALFKVLGTVPGYDEFDLSPFFMLSMPIFTAMLVGDAGYGLVFTIIGLLTYGRLARKKQTATAQLVLVFAITTLVWGIITGNAFGVGPDQLIGAGGIGRPLGEAWTAIAFLWRANAEAARDIVMQISFGIGFIHLSLAHIRAAIALAPDQRAVAEIGWVGFIFGMFTLVWFMFFKDKPAGALIPPMTTLWILVASWSLIVLFSMPAKNPIKRIGFGILGNLMSIPGAFGDMLSYIRLMAVGLASYYIASAFNELATGLTEASIYALPATLIVLLLAHALNIGLCLVAIFAHGVRLNMLEFSTNAGVQWVGYPYQPFAVRTSPDEGDA